METLDLNKIKGKDKIKLDDVHLLLTQHMA